MGIANKGFASFKLLCLLVAALYFFLFLQLMVAPGQMLADFGITDSEDIHILARRAAMLMLGFATLLFLVRNAAPSALRAGIAAAIAVNMGGFATMGSYEYLRGAAGTAILAPTAIEVCIALLYSAVAVRDSSQQRRLRRATA